MSRNNRDAVSLMRFSLFNQLAFAALILLSSSSSASTGEAMDWIQKMSIAMREISYQGRFVYLQNNQLESMSILHVKDDNGMRERLVSLNGEAREILRDNNNFTCIWPSSRQIVVDQSFNSTSSPIWIPEDVKRLSSFYEFSVIGHDRVAGQSAIIVSIMPADEYRYGMKVWINKENGLLLQSLLLDEQGQVLEQIMFSELSLMNEEEQKLFSVMPEIDSSYTLIRSHHDDQSAAVQSDNKWRFEAMPGGFWVESSFRKKLSGDDAYIQHLVLTDGMASVSVFIEPASEESLSGESSMGAVNAFGTLLNEYSVIAIGEVPAITVMQLARSTRYQP